MYCPNCGAQNPDGATNCLSCGAVFTYGSQAQAQNIYQPAQQVESQQASPYQPQQASAYQQTQTYQQQTQPYQQAQPYQQTQPYQQQSQPYQQTQSYQQAQPYQQQGQPYQQAQSYQTQEPQPQKKKSALPIIIGVVAAVAIIAVLVFVAFGNLGSSLFGSILGTGATARVYSHVASASESESDPESGQKADYTYDRDDRGNLRTLAIDRVYNDGDEFHGKIYYVFDDDGVPLSLKVVAESDDNEEVDDVDDDADDVDDDADDADDADDEDDDTLTVNVASVKDDKGRVTKLTYTCDDIDYVIEATYEYYGDTRSVKTLTYRTTERPESDFLSWNLMIFMSYLSFGDAAPLIDLANDCLYEDEDGVITFAEDGKVLTYCEYEYDSDAGEGGIVVNELNTPEKATRKSTTFTSDEFAYDSTTFTYDEAGDVTHIEYTDEDDDEINTEDFEYATINNASPWIQTISPLYY